MINKLSLIQLSQRLLKKLKRWSIFSLVLALTLGALSVMGIYWSSEPEVLRVTDKTSKSSPGKATVAMLSDVVDLLLNKPGGFLSNDIMPPGVLLDNMPSWEFGVLVQVRDLSKALRESFSRSQSQSNEDPDLALAEPRFNVDHKSWAVPWPEREYAEGQAFLKSYLLRLDSAPPAAAEFFARADNLRYWLATIETRLGSLSQRLSASVGHSRVDGLPDGKVGEDIMRTRRVNKTPWLIVDNVFYEARGTTWALLNFLQAVRVDFADILEKKGATASLEQIIYELEMSQTPLKTPVIVNGQGFGLFANHSLVMASYISRANAALIDLRDLLARG